MTDLPWYRKPLVVSGILGLLGFFLAPFTLGFQDAHIQVNIVWSLGFPMLASLAFGVRGALVAGSLGCLFPWLLWINNGWALISVSLAYWVFFFAIGWFSDERRKSKAWWNHPLISLIPCTLGCFLIFYLGFQFLMPFNPPPWAPGASNFMPWDTLQNIFFKDGLQFILSLYLVLVVLKINFFRKILGLEPQAIYRKNSLLVLKTVGAFLSLGYLVMVFTGIFMNGDLLKVLIPQGTAQEILSGFLVLSSSFIGAYFVTGQMEAQLTAEESLRNQQSRYRKSLDSLPVAVGVLGAQGEVLFLNKMFQQTFDYPMVDVPTLSDWIKQVYPEPEYLAQAQALWQEDLAAMAQGETKTRPREYKMRFKDGTFHQVILTTQIAEDSYFCIFQDVTDQHRLLEAAQRNQKLEALGLLAGGIAHDFNNLLAGIFGSIQLASLWVPPGKAKDQLDNCLKLMDRSRSLTHQLLTFAKGGAPEIKEEVLFPFLQETTAFALAGSGIQCRYRVPEGLWTCKCDRTQVSQVVENLVINARQALGTAGEVTLSAENQVLGLHNPWNLPSGDYLKVSVSDNGPGMDPEVKSRVFDPFFTTKAQGHGLGLATSHSIIKKHGGAFEVSSQKGMGTVFSFYLPATREGVPEAPAPVEWLNGQCRDGDAGVLVMDDEAYIRGILQDMLEVLGLPCRCFSKGEEVLEMEEKKPGSLKEFRAAILDLTIPGGMGGRLLAQELNRLVPEMEIYLISGYAEDPLLSDPGDLRIQGSLRKPFQLQELKRLICD